MPTPAHRASRALTRLALPVLILALLAFAILNGRRTDQAVNELRQLNAGQHQAQIAGCERGNRLRAQVTTNVTVLDEFIAAAVRARRQSGDTQVAERYEQLRAKLKPLRSINCRVAYPDTPR